MTGTRPERARARVSPRDAGAATTIPSCALAAAARAASSTQSWSRASAFVGASRTRSAGPSPPVEARARAAPPPWTRIVATLPTGCTRPSTVVMAGRSCSGRTSTFSRWRDARSGHEGRARQGPTRSRRTRRPRRCLDRRVAGSHPARQPDHVDRRRAAPDAERGRAGGDGDRLRESRAPPGRRRTGIGARPAAGADRGRQVQRVLGEYRARRGAHAPRRRALGTDRRPLRRARGAGAVRGAVAHVPVDGAGDRPGGSPHARAPLPQPRGADDHRHRGELGRRDRARGERSRRVGDRGAAPRDHRGLLRAPLAQLDVATAMALLVGALPRPGAVRDARGRHADVHLADAERGQPPRRTVPRRRAARRLLDRVQPHAHAGDAPRRADHTRPLPGLLPAARPRPDRTRLAAGRASGRGRRSAGDARDVRGRPRVRRGRLRPAVARVGRRPADPRAARARARAAGAELRRAAGARADEADGPVHRRRLGSSPSRPSPPGCRGASRAWRRRSSR